MPKKMKKIIKTCDTISHIQQYECHTKVPVSWNERGYIWCDNGSSQICTAIFTRIRKKESFRWQLIVLCAEQIL